METPPNNKTPRHEKEKEKFKLNLPQFLTSLPDNKATESRTQNINNDNNRTGAKFRASEQKKTKQKL